MSDKQQKKKGHPPSPFQPRCHKCRQMMGLADLHQFCYKCRLAYRLEYRCDGERFQCPDCASWSATQRQAFAKFIRSKIPKLPEPSPLGGSHSARDATGKISPLAPKPTKSSSHSGHSAHKDSKDRHRSSSESGHKHHKKDKLEKH